MAAGKAPGGGHLKNGRAGGTLNCGAPGGCMQAACRLRPSLEHYAPGGGKMLQGHLLRSVWKRLEILRQKSSSDQPFNSRLGQPLPLQEAILWKIERIVE